MRAGRPPLVHVLVVQSALSSNGGVVMSLELARRLEDEGARSEIFAVHPVRSGSTLTPDARIRVTHGVEGEARLRHALPSAVLRLLHACRRNDIVVAGSEVGLGFFLASLAARAAGRPLAVLVHADLDWAVEAWMPRRLRTLTRGLHRHVDAALCVSDAVRASVLRNGIDPRRVHLLRNGVDLAQLRRRAGEPSALPRGDVPRVVAVGRLSEEKGFDTLVRAHAAARRHVPHELAILGEGPLLTSLRRLADALGTRESVLLPGYLPNPFPVLAGADAFVLASRTEGLTLSLLEALALGVPVIATRCGSGVEEVLRGGEFGLLVDRDSPRALADAVEHHLRDPAPLRARARMAAAHVARYDSRETARRFLAVLGAPPPERETRAPSPGREERAASRR